MGRVMVVLGMLLLLSCTGPDESILPKKTTITESVYASATVQPDSLYQAYAAVAGILDKNLVEEGAIVRKGSPLAQITNTAPKLNAENAKLAFELAKENFSGRTAILTSLKDEIRSATLNLTNDSINYFRQKNLWEQNIGSKIQYENRKLAYELSQNNLRRLKNSYERTKKELFTQLEQARNNFKSSQITTNDFTVTSKINGKVYALLKSQGEQVSTMEPLATLGSANTFIIEFLVDEVDIVRLQVGQKSLVTLDAYANDVFEATISKIYPKKDERSQTFKVEATFNEPPEVLYPGLAGEGNILVATKQEALTIPKAYLVDGNKVRTDDGLVEVTLGLNNLEYVEVVAGIDENTAILKPRE